MYFRASYKYFVLVGDLLKSKLIFKYIKIPHISAFLIPIFDRNKKIEDHF